MAYIPIGDKTPKQRKEERKKREEEKLDQAGAAMLLRAHAKGRDRKRVLGPVLFSSWKETGYQRRTKKRKRELRELDKPQSPKKGGDDMGGTPGERAKRSFDKQVSAFTSRVDTNRKKREIVKEDAKDRKKDEYHAGFEDKFGKVLSKMKENAKRRQQGKKPKDVYKKDK